MPVHTPLRPFNPPRPNQPKNLPKTDKITPKLTKTAHPNRTIPRKTLHFRPIHPAEKKFPTPSVIPALAAGISPHVLLPFSRPGST